VDLYPLEQTFIDVVKNNVGEELSLHSLMEFSHPQFQFQGKFEVGWVFIMARKFESSLIGATLYYCLTTRSY